MAALSRRDFLTALLAEFPDLREGIEGCDGQLQMEMGAFALFTQSAKGRGDWPTFERCVALADRLLGDGDSALAGALRASYLEHLDFEGSRGPEAWRRLPPRLQTAWNHLAAENRRLMALPQKRKTPRRGRRR
jgi:hypothetical protein